MNKKIFSVPGFLAAALLSCVCANAADSILSVSPQSAELCAKAETPEQSESAAREKSQITETAVETAGETPAVQESAEPAAYVETAAVQTAAVQYVPIYESRIDVSGHVFGSWWDGFTRGDHALNLNQVWLTAERALDTETYCIDWGFRVDAVFGTDAVDSQCFNDEGFDGKWGASGDGYAASIFQGYFEFGINNLSVKLGKFSTTLGYESFNATENLFNSYSRMYDHEPMTHCGGLATYAMTDRLEVSFGVTAGCDNSFENHYGDVGLIWGASYQLTDCLSIGYVGMWNSVNETDGPRTAFFYEYADGMYWEEGIGDHDEYLQTVSISWDITDRLNYTFVTNYGWMGNGENFEHRRFNRWDYSGEMFGIANYLSYELTDKVTLAARYEWFQMSAENGRREIADADYHAVSTGFIYRPVENVFIRPEVRYDWVDEKTYGESFRDSGFSGGVGVGLTF